MILTIAPILGASLIAASLTVDEYHNCESSIRGCCRSRNADLSCRCLLRVRLRRRRFDRDFLRFRESDRGKRD
jgi:hypothetical protein